MSEYWSRLARLARLAMFLALGLSTSKVTADYLVMIDGRTLVGEVIEITSTTVKFRYSVNGIWSTVTFSLRHIDYYEQEEGDQSDLGKAAESEPQREDPRKQTPPKSTTGPRVVLMSNAVFFMLRSAPASMR